MITFYGDRKEGWTTMDRRLDHQGRWRHKTVAFRVSLEESEQIDRMVRLSGLTKQDYIIRRLQCQDIVVQGNPRVYKALRDQMLQIYQELKRIENAAELSEKFLYTLQLVAITLDGMKEEEE